MPGSDLAGKLAARRSCQQNEALVLGTLMQANGPLSAYDIARVASGRGSSIAPGQIYRTLERLIGQGKAVRIDLLNAYLPRPVSGDLCLVCIACHRVAFVEAPRLQASVSRVTMASGFTLVRGVVEALGRCSQC